ncbi:hypothetical protein B0H14DRAFT_3525522 [Mycena olivaceomarginata]|nr:hypothetical protein B0H14DRAFT_3525522 [Mycena olivaceomarginata]
MTRLAGATAHDRAPDEASRLSVVKFQRYRIDTANIVSNADRGLEVASRNTLRAVNHNRVASSGLSWWCDVLAYNPSKAMPDVRTGRGEEDEPRERASWAEFTESMSPILYTSCVLVLRIRCQQRERTRRERSSGLLIDGKVAEPPRLDNICVLGGYGHDSRRNNWRAQRCDRQWILYRGWLPQALDGEEFRADLTAMGAPRLEDLSPRLAPQAQGPGLRLLHNDGCARSSGSSGASGGVTVWTTA